MKLWSLHPDTSQRRAQKSRRRKLVRQAKLGIEFIEERIMLAADLTLQFDSAAQILHLRDNANGGRIVQSGRLDDEQPFLVRGTGDHDRLTIDLSTPFRHSKGVHFQGDAGLDQLVFLGAKSNELQFAHQSHSTGTLTLDGSSYTFDGVESVDYSDLSSSTQTITLAKDANLTLTQNDDGTLQTTVQYAFDANTDVSALGGADGFVIEPAKDSLTGQAVSGAGDVNADGIADLIVGAPGVDRAYVVFGTTQGFAASLDPTALDGSNGFVLSGPAGQNVGYAVSGGGDVNGDGIDDVIIGAPGPLNSFSSGAAYVLFGSASPFPARLDVSSLDGTNGFAVSGLANGDGAGFSVGLTDDVNGDSFADLIIGAPGADPGVTPRTDAGQAYLLFGTDQGFAANINLGRLDGKSGFALDGTAAGDAAGYAVAGAGDLNNDGLADVVIGAPGADPNGDGSGAAYAFFGAADFAVAEGLAGTFYDTGTIASLADARAAISSAVPDATFLAYKVDYPNSDAADTIDASTNLIDFLGYERGGNRRGRDRDDRWIGVQLFRLLARAEAWYVYV